MRVSFCTWLKGRPEIQLTLPINLALTQEHDVEFCIADCGYNRRVLPMIEAWGSPRVKIHSFGNLPAHQSVNKNLAHSLASGRILVNLDADNVIGPDYLRFLITAFANKPASTLVHTRIRLHGQHGTCGRIAIHRKLFRQLGGYDEGLGPVGYQDLDLIQRARWLGAKIVNCHDPGVVGLSVHTPPDVRGRYQDEDFDRTAMLKANKWQSWENIRLGRLVANEERDEQASDRPGEDLPDSPPPDPPGTDDREASPL